MTGDRRRMALAIHEAAHAVVGTVFDRDVEVSRLIAGDADYAGETRFCPLEGLNLPPVVLAAGVTAQSRFVHGTWHPSRVQLAALRHGCGRHDHAALLASGDPYVDPTPVVRRLYPAITELAVELYHAGEAGPGHVLAALGVPRGPSGPMYLSGLRTGATSLREPHPMPSRR